MRVVTASRSPRTSVAMLRAKLEPLGAWVSRAGISIVRSRGQRNAVAARPIAGALHKNSAHSESRAGARRCAIGLSRKGGLRAMVYAQRAAVNAQRALGSVSLAAYFSTAGRMRRAIRSASQKLKLSSVFQAIV